MRRADAEHEVAAVVEGRQVALDELDAFVEASCGGGAAGPVEGPAVGVDARARRRGVGGDDTEEQLTPAATEVEHVTAGCERRGRR